MQISGASLVENNRIFGNSGVGLLLNSSATSTSANRIYNNNVGVQVEVGYLGTVSNNYLVTYDRWLHDQRCRYNGGIPTFTNNTIIQQAGSAFRLTDNRTQNVLIQNNIVQLSDGFVYNLNPMRLEGLRLTIT